MDPNLIGGQILLGGNVRKVNIFFRHKFSWSQQFWESTLFGCKKGTNGKSYFLVLTPSEIPKVIGVFYLNKNKRRCTISSAHPECGSACEESLGNISIRSQQGVISDSPITPFDRWERFRHFLANI